MTTTPFEFAVQVILDMEGGYVNHPNDPGGETNFGISKRSYPDEDIRGLTRERAAAIYRTDFWGPCGADRLAWPLALYVFDAAVNSGVRRALRFLREAPTPDGYLERRRRFYHDLAAARPKARAFLRGWLRRLAKIKFRGLRYGGAG